MINELNYIDFIPETLTKSVWKGNTYESIDQVMNRVNEWIRSNYNRNIVNVETVVMPLNRKPNFKSPVSAINHSGGFVYNMQIIRVWYS